MNLRLGIQGKIALLVVVAAAISAYLVARLLSKSAEELLRSHELVDLGDEAELRAWEIADRVDGLREDTLAMGYNTAFQEKFAAGAPREALRTTCEEICRRYWRYHVRIDVLTFDENGRPLPPIPIEEKAATDPEGLRVPDADELAKIQRGRLLLLSRIERMRLRYPADETAGAVARERWEPVVWAYTPLAEPAEGSAAPPPLLRVLMTLDSGESPRHLFALMTPSGDFLARPDETVAGGGEGDNDRIFRALATHAEVRRHFEEENRMTPVEYRAEPQVEALHLFEYLPLESPYFFQEGVPRPNLRAAIDGIEETAMDLFFDGLRGRLAGEGRIGGLRLGTREARLLAGTPEKLDATRAAYDSALRERFGGAFDGLDWGPVVTCDEVHAWAIRLGIGTVEEKSVYVLLYAVMDDELASSIRQEMTTLRRYAFAVAVLAGAIAFAISLFFVYPLKRMTSMAQRVTESPPERLHTQLAEMVDELHVKRRDEVGDIARASKLLFEEVLESHERLENRVRERTAKLGQANLDLEEANEQLKSLSREKDSFVAKVSHDLRQPLNAIFLQVEALKLTDLDPLQASDVQKIHDHAARELSLVNDILEYQKIIMGAESLNRDRVAVPDLVAEVAEVHGKNADAKGIGFESAAEPATGEMEADRKRLRQILDNLAGNAVKFTAEGRVRIEANARTVDGADWIEFVVDDTGRGMGPEEQARAFVPFVSNKKGNEGGTGLGLSICRELCQRMGGRIGFVSEPGKGTRFSVLLPREAGSERYRARDEVSPPPGAEEPDVSLPDPDEETPRELETAGRPTPIGGSKAGGARVLIIDDDAPVRDMMRRLLEKEGFTVLTARDGAEGLRLARESGPDVVTLDVVMPDIDGWRVLSALKNDPVTEAIPVVMVSIMAERARGIALGVEDCLVKPIDLKRLSRVVHRVAGGAGDRHLLIVDDDEDSRRALARLLAEEGWRTLEAADGAGALRQLESCRPAAVILDLVMPGMDGFEFLAAFAARPEWRAVPVLVVTGKEPTPEESAYLKEHASAVIRKGESGFDDIVACVRQRVRLER